MWIASSRFIAVCKLWLPTRHRVGHEQRVNRSFALSSTGRNLLSVYSAAAIDIWDLAGAWQLNSQLPIPNSQPLPTANSNQRLNSNDGALRVGSASDLPRMVFDRVRSRNDDDDTFRLCHRQLRAYRDRDSVHERSLRAGSGVCMTAIHAAGATEVDTGGVLSPWALGLGPWSGFGVGGWELLGSW